MADNIEIRLEQLTQAIKGLYAKSSGINNEIYSALNSLSQRYENLTSVSSEKIASTIVNEFRKSLDTKYGQTNQFLRELESGLRELVQNQASRDPKFSAEISRVLNETSNAQNKLNSQELTLHKILGAIELQKNNDPTAEIIKLSENFMNFSRGFENITITLNKNFADFLAQIKEQSTKEEFNKIKSEIDVISGNVNSVISAISIIDTKYRDLTGLIDTIQNRENIFNEALREVRTLTNTMDNLKEQVLVLDSKDEIHALSSEIKNQIEAVKYEIQKIINTTQDSNIKEEIYSLTKNVQNLQINSSGAKEELSSLQKALLGFGGELKDIKNFVGKIDPAGLGQILSSFETELKGIKEQTGKFNPDELKSALNSFNEEIKIIQSSINTKDYEELSKTLSNLNNEIQIIQKSIDANDYNNLSQAVSNLAAELANIKSLINDEILFKSHQREAEFEKYLNGAKQDISNLISSLNVFKDDINTITNDKIKILQEPIERALSGLQNEEISQDIKELAQNLKNVTYEIRISIENLQKSLDSMNSDSSIQILSRLTETIPAISDKLETFQNKIVAKNIENLSEVQNSFSKTIAQVQESLLNSVDKIQQDTKSINQETLDILKIDLQKLSDHLIDGVENVNEKVEQRFSDYNTNFEKFTNQQTSAIERFLEKTTSLEFNLETFNKENIEKIQDALNINNARTQDNLSEIKGDILENISNFEKTNRDSLSRFEVKLDKILDGYFGNDNENSIEKKSLKQSVDDIESKIERTNLQQIHNAKELLEEIQASAADLTMKIESIEETRNAQGYTNVVSQVSEKLKNLETNNSELSDEIKNLKELLDQKLKDNIQKIAALVEKPQEEELEKANDETSLSGDFSELSSKVQEYLSNFEYLKNNISQEIKENLTGEFSRLETAIKKLRTTEDNENYSYTLEDIESDLTKICRSIEKNSINPEEFKNLAEKTQEIRSIGLENVKLNRDVEEELGHITGWCKDAVVKIDSLQERLDAIQNIGFADLKTRLVQSEKSKTDVQEQNRKIEQALKVLIKNARTKDENIAKLNQKVELITKAQTENFNPAQFIDIFYENMTQTKMLSNRVEIIEDKINSIQTAVEKLLSYVEEN